MLGWDISSRDIAQACEDARVLDIGLQDQLHPFLCELKPRPSIYCPDFIAANQEDRANNVLTGESVSACSYGRLCLAISLSGC